MVYIAERKIQFFYTGRHKKLNSSDRMGPVSTIIVFRFFFFFFFFLIRYVVPLKRKKNVME